MSQVEELVASLRDESFRNHVKQWSKDVRGAADNFYHGDLRGEYDDAFEYLEGNWRDSLDMGFDQYGSPEDIFSEVVDALAPPRIITARELGAAFDIYFAAGEGSCPDFDDVYEGFIDHVQFRLLADRFSPVFELCELHWQGEIDGALWMYLMETGSAIARAELLGTDPELPPCPDVPSDEPDEVTLWAGDTTSLRLIGVRSSIRLRARSLSQVAPNHGTLIADVRGRVSAEGMLALADELVPVMRSLFRSISLLCNSASLVSQDRHLPNVSVDDFQNFRAFIVGCAGVVFPPRGKKDTMDRRFHNALHLLSEADRQRSEAIGLALSVAAIEALLGQQGGELANSLADGVAVLLEPDTSYRSKASEFVKKLYNSRSRTLHGDALDESNVAADNARRLAAGCLYGLWCRHDLRHKLGEQPDKPDKLLEEIKEGKWGTGQLAGIPDIPSVRRLWGVT